MEMRTSKPKAGNKYYTRKSSGGYNGAVKGKPTDACDVLANCVGYANGRFAEIIGKDKIEYQLVSNAENFIEHAKEYGLTVVDYPTLGGIMVWQKGSTLNGSDGAGHVAVVERIDGANQIYTSESGYNSKPFWNSKRNNNNGRWGQRDTYTFRGCIVNPAIGDVHYEEPKPEPVPEPPKPEPVPEPTPAPVVEFNEGDSVIVNGVGTSGSDGSGRKTGNFQNRMMKIIAINKGAKNAYACNQYNEGKVRDYTKVTAWFSKDSLSK